MDAANRIQGILNMNIEAMSQDLDAVNKGQKRFFLNKICDSDLEILCKTTAKIFQDEPPVLQVTPPITIIGDLHGQIFDLYQILKSFDIPPARKYLFLGDLVDRGPFSIETVALVFTLKALYPNNVYVIRGNHEFESISLSGGFFNEIVGTYGNQNLFPTFVSCFEYMPLAAQIGQILCVHAGLSPDFKNISQLMTLKRPISTYDNSLLTGILWSDPSTEPTHFSASRRGTGFYFNLQPFREFLYQNNLKTLVRGHECVDGIKMIWDKSLITVFSASNYCGVTNNKGGVLTINDNYIITPHILGPWRYIRRNEAISSNKVKPTSTPLSTVTPLCNSSVYSAPHQQKMHKTLRLSRINKKLNTSQSFKLLPNPPITHLSTI